MCCRQVSAEHFAAPAAIETDHEVTTIRSVDGDRRRGDRRDFWRLAKLGEGSVDDRDKVGKFAGGDAVVRDVAADNLGDDAGVDRLRFSHRFPPPIFIAGYFCEL